MQVNLNKIRKRRVFSIDLKKQIVKQYEKGENTVLELSRFYQVSTQSVYTWIYKYSNIEKQSIQVVEMKQSNSKKQKELEAKIAELERAVGVKQMNIDFLEKMIDLASQEYGIDIKKNFSTPQSTGLEKTKGN